MSNYRNHAMQEFRAAGWTTDEGKFNDDMQEMICDHVLKLLEVFSDEGHSGSTAPYTINLFEKLAKFEPIAPLTGEDWEWSDVAESSGRTLWQNKRCSHVFKEGSGQAYDIDGKVFWEWGRGEDGQPYKMHYTCKDSRVPVTFPYSPRTVYEWRHSDADPQTPAQTEAGFI